MLHAFRRFTAGLLIVSLAGIGLPLPAQAGMLTTDAALATQARDTIAGMLQRADVQAQLESLGVSPSEVSARVAAMTDAEVAQLAANVESLPAGGDALGVIVFVFLVLLVTDILGYTKIFPFTRSVR